eukprot:7922403-Ditylum_brightwellii.AAC.1
MDMFDDNTKSLSDEEYGPRGEKKVCPEDSGSVDRERAIFRDMSNAQKFDILKDMKNVEKFDMMLKLGKVQTYPADCYSFIAIHSPIEKPLFFFFVHDNWGISGGDIDNPSG